ncbi:MAG: hypothetical protein ACON4J_08360 [Parvibaculales bacterium]
MRHLYAFSALWLWVLAVMLGPSQKAYALDVVLVSDNLRVMNITQSVSRISPDQTDFAIQNTSDIAIAFELHISGRDVFHEVFLGREHLPGHDSYRLIGSDDTELPPLSGDHLSFRLTLQPGEVKRFLLIGPLSQNPALWLWDRHYLKQVEVRTASFRKLLLLTVAFFGVLCIPTAVIHRRKRFVMPSILALIFGMLLYLRWEYDRTADGLSELRGLMVLAVVYIFFAHRALNRVPWTERRYWRTVIFLLDLLLVAVTGGWILHYFSPFYVDGFMAERLEMLLAMVPILLCLAVILYLLPQSLKPSPDRN